MIISDALLPEFDQEMANTRKTLERVPEDKLGWKPHEKSMTMGRLAGHLAELPGGSAGPLEADTMDIAPVGKPAYQALTATSRKQVLEMFDKHVSAARAAIAGASDAELMQTW